MGEGGGARALGNSRLLGQLEGLPQHPTQPGVPWNSGQEARCLSDELRLAPSSWAFMEDRSGRAEGWLSLSPSWRRLGAGVSSSEPTGAPVCVIGL